MPDKESRTDASEKPFGTLGRRDVLKTTAVAAAAAGGVSTSAAAGSGLPELPVIEDFERSDPLAEYGGSTSLFDTTASPTYEGSQALVNDSGSFGGVNSTSGLNEYPERGDDVFVYFQNAGDENFVSFNLFSQAEVDNPDRYAIGLSGIGGDLTLWKIENGATDTLDSSAPSSTTSGWYRLEISTDDTTVSADLYDDSSDTLLASVSTSDTTFSSGGIGFRSAGNGEVFDYVVLDGEFDDVEGVVEDFERANPLNEYGGSTGLFDTTSSAYEGSQALINDGGSFGGVNSTSGLAVYPERGDEVHVYINNAPGDNFVSFNLFSQAEVDDPDRYSVGLSGVSGDWTLWKTENGSIEALDSSAPSDTTSGWYRAEISTDSSTVSADLYDDSSDQLLASVSANDSTFSSGGIGFRSAGNGEVFDYVVLADDVAGEDDVEIEVSVDDVEHPEEVVVNIDVYSDDDWIYEADDGVVVSVGDQTQTDDLLIGSHNVYEFTFEKDVGTHEWDVEVEAETRRESFDDDPESITGQTLTDEGTVEVEEGDGDPTPGDETIFLDFDAATWLEDPPASYDRVHDTRGSGNYAELGGLIDGTVHDDTHIQFTAAGNSSSGSKSSNTTVELWHDHRVGYIPQEVYFEVDIYLGPEYYLDGTDTDRWGWIMNRYGGNEYSSNTGNGFSNAFGTTPRGNPPSGTYAFFSYAYDSTNTGTTGNFIEHINQNSNAYIPIGEWVTFAGYCKCNDIGQSNAVQKFYRDGDLIAYRGGFQTSASSQDDWCSEVGMLGYYIDSGGGTSINSNKERHFDNHRIWVDDDIPGEIRE